MMHSLILADQTRTDALAQAVALKVRAGDVIALSGEMGMGKSAFARSFLRSLAQNPHLTVPSPTFALVQPYDLPVGPVTHFDLWRLGDQEEMEALGWDHARAGIVLVEWPERAPDFMEEDALTIVLRQGACETERLVTLGGWPDRLEGLLTLFSAR